ncbi:FAD-dependent oxidoreductase [bacterium]|nr:FAD-dependent oxidoreductase [bacterium]
MTKECIGSVMVVGSGVGGIQSALDLADSGFLVYLVENSSAIGGVMAQLDKTFPTNDCSMCIISPKLVEVGRHHNIKLLTNTDLISIDGDPGNFTATVRQNPRFIDIEKCTGCGDCASVCPVEIPDEYEEGLSLRKAAYKKYTQAIPGAYAIQKTDKAPCHLACPAGLNVQGYVQMVKEGKFQRALEIIMKDLPLPGVLGRVCPHGCEDACRRCDVDTPVAIRDLKRLAADRFDPRKIKIECLPKRKEKVAIIGSGPAGLSTAYHLARKGVISTIFEALPEAGGMLRVGIPEHRLPREVLDREIEVITNLGVEIKTNTALGPELTIGNLMSQGFKSIYLATGAHAGIELGIPGETAAGVVQGVSFLKELNLEGSTKTGKKVAIVGGGNVAIDVSRSAIRLGAEEVTILYRRTRSEMPAFSEEIDAAVEEGIRIEFLSAPQEILTENGKVSGVRCIRMELGEADSSGRRSPIPVPDSEFDIKIDQLIPAIGQRPDISPFKDIAQLNFSRWGTLETNSVSYATDLPGVFAGGDLQTGPWTVIGAIAAGKEAAVSIVRYLDGDDLTMNREVISNENPEYRPIKADEIRKSRIEMPHLAVEERNGNFREVELGYDETSGRKEAGRCLNCSYCCECEECVQACLAKAINHDDQGREEKINIGAVILASGSEVFDTRSMEGLYLYNSHPNVLSSIEFERVLCATGPTEGHLLRLSDKTEPKKIAWLQCIGSRNSNDCDNGYCSSVCCMYAIKEALIAKEHSKEELDTAIFYMDMRTHGKGYEQTYVRAKDESGVRFIQSRIHTIENVPATNDLKLTYQNESGELKHEIFNMVILSAGLQASQAMRELAAKLDIAVDRNGFIATDSFNPVETSRHGIYTCGTVSGPKDIPQSVLEASAASATSAALLGAQRGTLTSVKTYPQEIEINGQVPRVGVFICHCGINIGGIVDVPSVTEYAKTLPNVVYATHNLFSCSQDTQESIRKVIEENNLNRVVVAACTPRTHEPLFQETMQEAGLNRYLFEFANIRDQNSWVHQKEPLEATDKAMDLIRMAAAKVSLLEPIERLQLDLDPSAMVIGGGIAGMTAAMNLADQGFKTFLVERQETLGGSAKTLDQTWKGEDIQEYLSELNRKVISHDKIEVLTQSEIVKAEGYVGNFITTVQSKDESREINHGAVIIATGAQASETSEYLHGKHNRILKWHEIDEKFKKDPSLLEDTKAVAFIQCVNSRDENNPYCSRICCTASITSAISLKKKKPGLNIYMLYRDIRTFGQREELYKEARQLGVIFIRFDSDHHPEVITDGPDRLKIKVIDHILKRPVQLSVDYVNLATAIVPPEGQKDLAKLYKVPINDEGFFMEAHIKLRPVDFSTDGVFVCGLSHYPKPIDESISQAQAAAGRAAGLLSKKTIYIEPIVSVVDTDKCIGCGLCEYSCVYSAIRLEEIAGKGYRAANYSALCKGCGVCAAACPQSAIDMKHFRYEQILAAISAGGLEIHHEERQL